MSADSTTGTASESNTVAVLHFADYRTGTHSL